MNSSVFSKTDVSAHTQAVTCSLISQKDNQDFKLLATGGEDCRLNIWKIDSSLQPLSVSKVWQLTANKASIQSLCFDNGEQCVVSGSLNGSIKVFDLKEGKVARSIGGHQTRVSCLQYHPYGEFIASGCIDCSMKLWDVRNKSCIQTYSHHEKEVTCVKFSPDGRWVASASRDSSIIIYDIVAGKQQNTLKLGTAYCHFFEFNPSEYMLAAATSGRQVRLFDLDSNSAVGSTPAESSLVRTVAYSNDGTSLYTATKDYCRHYVCEAQPELRSTTDVVWERLQDMKIVGASACYAVSHQGETVTVYHGDLSIESCSNNTNNRSALNGRVSGKGGEFSVSYNTSRSGSPRAGCTGSAGTIVSAVPLNTAPSSSISSSALTPVATGNEYSSSGAPPQAAQGYQHYAAYKVRHSPYYVPSITNTTSATSSKADSNNGNDIENRRNNIDSVPQTGGSGSSSEPTRDKARNVAKEYHKLLSNYKPTLAETSSSGSGSATDNSSNVNRASTVAAPASSHVANNDVREQWPSAAVSRELADSLSDSLRRRAFVSASAVVEQEPEEEIIVKVPTTTSVATPTTTTTTTSVVMPHHNSSNMRSLLADPPVTCPESVSAPVTSNESLTATTAAAAQPALQSGRERRRRVSSPRVDATSRARGGAEWCAVTSADDSSEEPFHHPPMSGAGRRTSSASSCGDTRTKQVVGNNSYRGEDHQIYAPEKSHPMNNDTSTLPLANLDREQAVRLTEAAMQNLLGQSVSFTAVLSSRVTGLQALRRLWLHAGGLSDPLLRHLSVQTEGAQLDPSLLITLADFLSAVELSAASLTLAHCCQLLPLLEALLSSRFEYCVTCSLEAAVLIVRPFAQLISTTRHSAQGPMDLSQEERLNRCNQSCAVLRRISSSIDTAKRVYRQNNNIQMLIQQFIPILYIAIS